jgi:hypothetical protein
MNLQSQIAIQSFFIIRNLCPPFGRYPYTLAHNVPRLPLQSFKLTHILPDLLKPITVLDSQGGLYGGGSLWSIEVTGVDPPEGSLSLGKFVSSKELR